MNPFKKSMIGSVLLIGFFLKFYTQYRDSGTYDIYSFDTIILILAYLAIYFEYGNDIGKTKDSSEEEE